MSPAPLYHPSADHAAYQLRYAWTGWLSAQSLLPEMSAVIDAARSGWEPDGLRALEARCIGDKVQILFSSTPDVSPSTIAARAKGRIDHAARQCGRPIQFSRAFAVRSVGENSRRDIEAYIERQVAKERYVDTRWRETMERFTLRNNVDLARPATPKRGRYWYNLHVVLEVADRGQLRSERHLAALCDAVARIADRKGHLWSRLSVMPDHLHVALRPRWLESPLDVVFCYQNNLAYILGCRLWKESFYVGTFGEYAMQAVRNQVAP